jgi:translation elongation factor EF-Ts
LYPPEHVALFLFLLQDDVDGRIRKYLEEISLVSQAYVRDSDKIVGQLLKGNGAKIIGFTRIEVGEGIQKKVDNFGGRSRSNGRQGPSWGDYGRVG